MPSSNPKTDRAAIAINDSGIAAVAYTRKETLHGRDERGSWQMTSHCVLVASYHAGKWSIQQVTPEKSLSGIIKDDVILGLDGYGNAAVAYVAADNEFSAIRIACRKGFDGRWQTLRESFFSVLSYEEQRDLDGPIKNHFRPKTLSLDSTIHLVAEEVGFFAKPPVREVAIDKEWPELESNQRHKDFQSWQGTSDAIPWMTLNQPI